MNDAALSKILSLSPALVEQRIQALDDEQLDAIIEITDNAAVANRLARIERGRRHDDRRGANLTPGVRSLTSGEMKKRSEERKVAEYNPTPEEVETLGWKKLVTTARKANRPAPPPAPPLPAGTYDLILADPPWRYDYSPTTSRDIENQYPTMTHDDICNLQIPSAPTSILYLWATAPKLAEALQVIEAWGYTYRTGMVWVKDRLGMGYWARGRHEHILIAAKGNPKPPEPHDRPDSVISEPRREHSSKPDILHHYIDTAYPTATKLELFARQPRPGWDTWGNEI